MKEILSSNLKTEYQRQTFIAEQRSGNTGYVSVNGGGGQMFISIITNPIKLWVFGGSKQCFYVVMLLHSYAP